MPVKGFVFHLFAAVALMAVSGLFGQPLNAAPKTGERAACATVDRALPPGHPSLDPPAYFGTSICAVNGYSLASVMWAGRTRDMPAQRLSGPQPPVFEHVSLTSADGTPGSFMGECADCHGDTQVLSEGHVPTTGMTMDQCRACHAPETELSLRGEMPLDHLHGLSGVGCTSCHVGEETAMTEPPMEVCQACHGTLEELAAATAHVQPTNPHMSPHGAPYAVCSLCHMQHEPSENFCASCHDFEFDLP